jgi:hypothetical protein
MKRLLGWLEHKLDVLFMAPPYSPETDATLAAWRHLG